MVQHVGGIEVAIQFVGEAPQAVDADHLLVGQLGPQHRERGEALVDRGQVLGLQLLPLRRTTGSVTSSGSSRLAMTASTR